MFTGSSWKPVRVASLTSGQPPKLTLGALGYKPHRNRCFQKCHVKKYKTCFSVKVLCLIRLDAQVVSITYHSEGVFGYNQNPKML